MSDDADQQPKTMNVTNNQTAEKAVQRSELVQLYANAVKTCKHKNDRCSVDIEVNGMGRMHISKLQDLAVDISALSQNLPSRACDVASSLMPNISEYDAGVNIKVHNPKECLDLLSCINLDVAKNLKQTLEEKVDEQGRDQSTEIKQ